MAKKQNGKRERKHERGYPLFSRYGYAGRQPGGSLPKPKTNVERVRDVGSDKKP